MSRRYSHMSFYLTFTCYVPSCLMNIARACVWLFESLKVPDPLRWFWSKFSWNIENTCEWYQEELLSKCNSWEEHNITIITLIHTPPFQETDRTIKKEYICSLKVVPHRAKLHFWIGVSKILNWLCSLIDSKSQRCKVAHVTQTTQRSSVLISHLEKF